MVLSVVPIILRTEWNAYVTNTSVSFTSHTYASILITLEQALVWQGTLASNFRNEGKHPWNSWDISNGCQRLKPNKCNFNDAKTMKQFQRDGSAEACWRPVSMHVGLNSVDSSRWICFNFLSNPTSPLGWGGLGVSAGFNHSGRDFSSPFPIPRVTCHW